MKKIYILCYMVFLPIICTSQMHEVGLFIGGSNYIGDIGSRDILFVTSPAFGLVYKYNIKTRYSLRGSIMYSKLENKNHSADDLNRFRTFLSVENNILELSAGVEFNFFEFNLHDENLYFTPYVYFGVNYFQYDLFYIDKNMPIDVEDYGTDRAFSIPMTVGAKLKISPQFSVGAEIGARYALTDNIDGSSPVDQFSKIPQLQHGSLYNNDWYIFTGMTLSFTFGRLPCYCKE